MKTRTVILAVCASAFVLAATTARAQQNVIQHSPVGLEGEADGKLAKKKGATSGPRKGGYNRDHIDQDAQFVKKNASDKPKSTTGSNAPTNGNGGLGGGRLRIINNSEVDPGLRAKTNKGSAR